MPWKLGDIALIRAGLPERYRAVVDLGAGCGMRQGEVFGLAVDDIDLNAGWLHIQRHRDRRVPLPGSVADALRQHMKDHPPLTITLPWEDPTSAEQVTASLVLTSHPA